jgi:hypothetical protein
VTADTVCKLLVKKAGSKENSVGFFGWADDYLFRSLVNGLNEPTVFLTQVARFTALMVSGEAPESLAFFATAGSIKALNKLSTKENDALIAAGKDPKVRPINSGCTFGKYAVNLLTETPSSLKIKRSMQHLNLGMGTPVGSEKIANILQMVYKTGGVVVKEDITNAFNALKRQHMRIQQDKVLPEATKNLNFFYGDRSIVLYSHRDEMGVDHIVVIFSEEGPRMGYTAGTFLFGISIQPVCEALSVEFPNVILVAHTDDLLKAVLSPGDGEDWGTKVTELHECDGR